MKVILKQDVKGLGRKMTWLMSATVMPGIFISRGLAVEANQGNLNIMKTRKEAEKSKKDREMAHARELAEKLRNVEVVIRAKTGESGKLSDR